MNESEQIHINQPQVVQDLRRDPTYLSLLRAYGARFVEIVVAGVMVNLLGLLMPLYSRLVYDKVIGNHIPETLWALTLGMLLFIGLELVLRLIRVYYTEQLAGRLDAEFDETSARRLLSARVTAPIGTVLARYRDLSSARDLLSSNYMLLLVDIPFLVLYVVVLGFVAGHLVWVLLVGGALLVLGQLLFKLPSHDYANAAMQAGAGKVDKLASIVYGMETLKTSQLQHRLMRAFLSDAADNAVAQAKSRFWTNAGYAVTSVLYTVISVGTLVVGVYLVEDNALTVGALIAGSLLISRAVGVLSLLAAFLARIDMFRRARAEFDRLFEQEEKTATADVLRRDMPGLIQIGNLTLHLDKAERPTLKKVSLTIQPGEKVGIVGRSGSGKSMLMRALAGLHKPEEGHVLVDGVAVTAYTPEARMGNIGFKPQEPFIFDGTVAANIFVDDRVPGPVYEAALGVSGLDELIARGELRLDQMLKAPGNLSGGQRQILALARVLATAPRILLLDEPTTGVDQQTEARIIERLAAFAAGRTLVVATHSPALLRHVDRIVVIDGGRIVADGPREQMLE